MALYLDGKKYKITLNSNSTSNVVTTKEEHAKKQTEGDDRLLEVLSRKRERKG